MYRRVRGPILLLALCVLPMRMAMAQRIKMAVKLSELEARVKADSNDPAAHYNVALGYWNEKRWEDAERSIRTAIMLEPRFAPAHLALAYLPYGRQPKLWDAMWGRKLTPEDTKVLRESDQEYRRAFMIDPLVDIRILGAVTRTTQKLQIARIDADRQLLLIRGAVPGAKGGDLIVHPSVKAGV